MFQLGMSLYEGDEVQTGENGRAKIRFSSKGEGNVIILGTNTRITIKRISSRFDYSVYRVSVLEGKIWARDLPSQTRRVRVRAGKSNILPFGGQYVVEQNQERTIAAASAGNIRIMDNSTNRYTPLSPGKIASVSQKTGQLMLLVIPERLMADFQSGETQAAGKISQQINALIAGEVADVNKILQQEAKEAAVKKAHEAALRKEKEEARRKAEAKDLEKKEEEKFLMKKELVEKRAREMEKQLKREMAAEPVKSAPVDKSAAEKERMPAAVEHPGQTHSKSMPLIKSPGQEATSGQKAKAIRQETKAVEKKPLPDKQPLEKQAQKPLKPEKAE